MLAFRVICRFMFLGDSKGDIRILSSITFQTPPELDFIRDGLRLSHRKAIVALSSDPREKVLFSVCSHNLLKMWNLKTGFMLRKISMGKEYLNIRGAIFLVSL